MKSGEQGKGVRSGEQGVRNGEQGGRSDEQRGRGESRKKTAISCILAG